MLFPIPDPIPIPVPMPLPLKLRDAPPIAWPIDREPNMPELLVGLPYCPHASQGVPRSRATATKIRSVDFRIAERSGA
jgi:hypothetical protein